MSQDTMTSPVDGSYLLPMEQMVPDNISMFKAFNTALADISTFMDGVQTAVYNYEKGFTTKIILNPADLRTYIEKIRTYLLNMSGGYADDGITAIPAQATHIIPDLLMTLRDNQLTLCQLYAVSEDTQGAIVGPLDDVQIEDTTTTDGEGEI